MNVRLIILIVVAAGLAVYFVVRPKPAPSVEPEEVAAEGTSTLSPEEQAKHALCSKPLAQRPLPGEEPPEPAQFNVEVTVNTLSGKNQLCFDITEEHGYYAETLILHFWWTNGNEDVTYADAVARGWLALEHVFDSYIEANSTLHKCLELGPSELEQTDGTMETDRHWRANIVGYNRARVENPDPLPCQGKAFEHAGKLITGKAPGSGP